MEAMVGSALWTTAGGTAVGSAGLFGAAGSLGAGGLITGAMSGLGGTLLTGLMTGAGAYGQMQTGNMQANILSMQANQSELNARMETLKGRQQSLTIKKQLERDLASQNATFAARGVLQGEGSSLAASDASKDNAEEDINIAMFGSKMGSESDKLQAAQYRLEGKSAKTMGRTEAINSVTSSRGYTSLLESL